MCAHKLFFSSMFSIHIPTLLTFPQSQPITVQIVAFRITLGTNLAMLHAALS